MDRDAPLGELLGDQVRGALLLEAELGMGMDVAAQRGDLRRIGQDGFDDLHGGLRGERAQFTRGAVSGPVSEGKSARGAVACRWGSRGRVPVRARPRRSAALRAADCPALLGVRARRRTRYVRFAHCAQTAAASQIDDARCARAAPRPALLGALHARRPGTRPRLLRPGRARCWHVPAVSEAGVGCPAGRVGGAEQRRTSGPARAQLALRGLTCRSCLSVATKRASEFLRQALTPSSAGESARSSGLTAEVDARTGTRPRLSATPPYAIVSA